MMEMLIEKTVTANYPDESKEFASEAQTPEFLCGVLIKSVFLRKLRIKSCVFAL
jgi:hypothetical protein